MTTVLVTGAGGYIGRHVVRACKEFGCRVVAADIRDPQMEEIDRFIQADLIGADVELAKNIDETIDACIHLAWRNGFNHNADTHMGDLFGHIKFLRACMEAGIPRISVMGTMHEVGYWEGAITADTPCNPQSYYGIAKDALRRSCLLEAAKSESSLRWLRAYYIHGDDAASQSIFGKIARAAAEGQKTFPFTTGKNMYDFILVNELGRQIAACSLQDEYEGIINVCTGEPMSLADRIEGFIAENGFDIKLDYGAFPDRPYDSPGVWGDATTVRAIMAAYEK